VANLCKTDLTNQSQLGYITQPIGLGKKNEINLLSVSSIYNIKYLTYGALSREQFLSLALPATAP